MVLMSGGSRGIGLAIARPVACDGATVVLLARTDRPDPRLPGTAHTAVAELEDVGGKGLAVVGDVRNETNVAAAVDRAMGVDDSSGYRDGAAREENLITDPFLPGGTYG